ncbi:MAG: short-chain dehydrogenase/reductase [Chryseobacterium sp.]|nr:MAG: short-chain dehydrogenase/reductase [Chryseobacterium sp.]
MQKTIFITGASTGLGKETAKFFQSKGWNVIATMRSPEKEPELTKLENVTVLPLDVTNVAQIKTTAQKAMGLGVDVVFNNAGYGLMGALEAISDEKIQRQLNTNLLGVIRVTQAFIPYFREKKKGLFITTTSIGGLVAFPTSSIYHATKWALEGWSESLYHELALFGIGVKTVAPGGIITDFASRSLDLASHPLYDEITQKTFALFDPTYISSATQIAEVVYEAATDDKDQIRYVAGNDAKATYARRLEIGNEAFRQELHKNIFG